MNIQENLKELKEFYEQGFITRETWEEEQKKILELWHKNKVDGSSTTEIIFIKKEDSTKEDNQSLALSSVFLEVDEKSKTLLDSNKSNQSPSNISSKTVSSREILHGHSYTKGKFIPTQYRLIKQIGQGGIGYVYLAENIETSEKVAIKFLNLDPDENLINTKKQNVMDRFFRELQLLMSLDHPYIVNYKGQGNYNDKAFIVMEYVQGENLYEIIVQKKFNLKNILVFITQMIDVLLYAQNKQIIHRDIKPQNIIINQQNTVKLIDLGMSKALNETLKITRTGEFMGTPLYMAPEQITSPGSEDFMCDVYALGATLYHLLCGIAPFSEYKNIRQVLSSKAEDLYIPLVERQPNIPPFLLEIVKNTMNLNPKKRWNLKQVKKVLHKFEGSRNEY